MKVSKGENIIISWFLWHFYEMPKFLFLIWKNYISFSADFFSVPLLIKTFFSPWKKYKWKYPKGFNIGEFFSTLISNIFSRIIGVIFRFALIVLGVAAQIFTLAVGGIVILFWLLVPVIFIALVVFLFNMPQ